MGTNSKKGKNLMNRKIPLLISVVVFTGLLVGGCAKAATPVPTATPTNTPSPAPTIQPGDSTRTLKVGDLNRSYILHIPPGIDMVRPVPLVFVFHGYTSQPQEMEAYGFNEISDSYGFLVVYPGGGLGLSWNAGGCCGPAVTNNIDDIAGIRAILSDLGTIASIDPKRIYATGHSNGGMFSYRLGCEMSDTFAAIASVSGPLFYATCQPQQPVSVLHEHGLGDTEIPYAGGMGNSVVAGVIFPPVEQGIATWVQIDGCNTSPTKSKQGLITHTIYSGCRAGTAVEIYTIDVQGHSWPSAYVLPFTKIAWEFFAAHPKP
jgi:polyhydroxybutyrate depolymerase